MIFKRKKNLTSALKHQLILEEQVHVADALGGYSNSWQEVATLWAEIVPISGSEYLASKQITNQVRHRITLRYREQILPSMRLRDPYTSTIYDIKSVIDVMKEKTMIEIIADAQWPNTSY